ncbi:tannase/feruloyl esterase family alpha/beta hydrolase [Vibrio mangrovi]|uniref:Tannase and feruloyl esterase n=1 Tax=Vibrio mangrovi TaxID=474394 RepID=A0A1Y6IVI4_9VIBR|nr:tannase/feruloyl esterase family alpha/beta hydrolase [Vibrio mangrovi]MDW6004532.1 tannase/feruloyl esterase family alpha/beta hydrolase [Vibrio mangrovi]SMS00820.1 Tannase and feruloyl esterase [Vibrio mangrovi]
MKYHHFMKTLVLLAPMWVAGGANAQNIQNAQQGVWHHHHPSPAVGAKLSRDCASLSSFEFPNTTITGVSTVAKGELQIAGKDVGEHCLVEGKMFERVSSVDGETYAIGFEMRLPKDWNGRFMYQANGGLDGNLIQADGIEISGGGPLNHPLYKGFAIISSDAGHSNFAFGVDPQARLDYGYQAEQKLTPMAKLLVATAYGKLPDYSYFAGGSNGGRHTMVAASRMPEQYDGFLALSPGFHLPKAAIAQLYAAQRFAEIAPDKNDLSTAFNDMERRVVADAILAKCDALDGLADGMVFDTKGCEAAFDLQRDVPVCESGRDGTCLTQEQKDAVDDIFSGARTSKGQLIYSPFVYDPGLMSWLWGAQKFTSTVTLDPVAVGTVFMTPPYEHPEELETPEGARKFALNFDIDNNVHRIFKTTDVYRDSSMSFMTPPDETNLSRLKYSGGKMMVIIGDADAMFSSKDTEVWYDKVRARNYDARSFVRFFRIPGMGHTRSGIAADQYDSIDKLVEWVEQGIAPDSFITQARGEGNPGGVNREIPADWAADRTRPICAYPNVAVYSGFGDSEKADSFVCKEITH